VPLSAACGRGGRGEHRDDHGAQQYPQRALPRRRFLLPRGPLPDPERRVPGGGADRRLRWRDHGPLPVRDHPAQSGQRGNRRSAARPAPARRRPRTGVARRGRLAAADPGDPRPPGRLPARHLILRAGADADQWDADGSDRQRPGDRDRAVHHLRPPVRGRLDRAAAGGDRGGCPGETTVTM
ncbi:MAG: NADH-ubiquinone oxidoreductase chain J, partial [uncultured Thermomicrobiales bacterium]